MGSKYGYGYEYRYTFSMVDEDDIESKYKSRKAEDGYKTFIFDVRTNFNLVLRRAQGSQAGDDEEELVFIDSERFDAPMSDPDSRDPSRGDPDDSSVTCLYLKLGYRLRDYWMTHPEILRFSRAALGFAQEMAASPQNASLSLIPMVVSFQVRTLQRKDESYEAAMDRAICSGRLIPLYLWRHPTITEGSCKPMTDYRKGSITCLPRVRNQIRLGREWVCSFCSRGERLGDQITLLNCGHTFHSRCIARWLEDDNACPKCGHEVENAAIVALTLRKDDNEFEEVNIVRPTDLMNPERQAVGSDW